MKTITFSLALLLFMIAACNSDHKNDLSTNDVPKLLDRSEKIQLGKEWDYVQNSYSDLKQQILEKKNPNIARLSLAQIFINEARITGEHGHYYPAAYKLTNAILSENEITADLKFRTLVTKASIELSQHEFSDALATGEQALALNSNNASVYGVLVDSHVELGNYDKAVSYADKMITIKPDLRSYSRVSYLREIHGDVDGAMSAMKLAIEAGFPGYEDTAWSMLTLADIKKKYGDNQGAEQLYKNILNLRPDYPFAVAALGDIALEKGNTKKAEELLTEAINIIPEVGYYVSLAQVYKKTNRTQELKDITKEIFVMLKEDVDSGHNMNLEYASVFHELIKDQEQALKYALSEYEQRPKNIDVNMMLAKIYMSMDDKESAKRFLAAAKKTNSKYPDLIKLDRQLDS